MSRYGKGSLTFSGGGNKHTSNTHEIMTKVKLAQADLNTRLSHLSGTYPISNNAASTFRDYLSSDDLADEAVGINKKKDLNEFLNKLVDYMSYTQFCLYQVTETKSSAPDDQWQVSDEFIQKILYLNDTLLNFVDKYTEAPNLIDSHDFKKDISDVWLTLETRFQMEDKLVNGMRKRIQSKIENHQSDVLDDPDLTSGIDWSPDKPRH